MVHGLVPCIIPTRIRGVRGASTSTSSRVAVAVVKMMGRASSGTGTGARDCCRSETTRQGQ
eukprot:scaffold1112_cov92-Amphora_coffeaeformis.AAC.21